MKAAKTIPHAAEVAGHFMETLRAARPDDFPYRHWELRNVLPDALARAIIALPIEPPVVLEHDGTRESFNEKRTFLTPGLRAQYPAVAALTEALQRPEVARLVEETCRIRLAGAHLRIEYIQDTDGAWLQPHPDIPDKLFSMVVYLFTGPYAKDWGTDIYDAEKRRVGRASGEFNSGVIFIPARNTFHGFEKRKIIGVRRLMEINYVQRWRDRRQLAFPDEPVLPE